MRADTVTERELRKLNRRELVELVLSQTRRTEELEDKLIDSERRLAEMKRQLNEKQVATSNVGSLAEAALRLNGVFEAADAAAQQYMQNAKDCNDRSAQLLEETRRRCEEMERTAEAKVASLKAELDRLSEEWGITSYD